MPIKATVFTPPHGTQTIIDVIDITDEDAAFFNNNNIKISMEELSIGSKVIYADWNGIPEDEALVLVPEGVTCKQAMTQLRIQVEKLTYK
jgi:hypothetical protein